MATIITLTILCVGTYIGSIFQHRAQPRPALIVKAGWLNLLIVVFCVPSSALTMTPENGFTSIICAVGGITASWNLARAHLWKRSIQEVEHYANMSYQKRRDYDRDKGESNQ